MVAVNQAVLRILIAGFFGYAPNFATIKSTSAQELSRDNKAEADDNKNTCQYIQAKCNFRSGCSLALQSFVFECDPLIKNRTNFCSDSCKNSLIGLTSTDEGQKFMNCDCDGNAECRESRARIETCRASVTYATRLDTIVTCTEAQWICMADSECSKALEYYNIFCRGLFRGKRCTSRCRNSLAILSRQEKAIKLAECRCEPGEMLDEFPCSQIKQNTLELCDVDFLKAAAEQKSRLLLLQDLKIQEQERLEQEAERIREDLQQPPLKDEDEVLEEVLTEGNVELVIHHPTSGSHASEDSAGTALSDDTEEIKITTLEGNDIGTNAMESLLPDLDVVEPLDPPPNNGSAEAAPIPSSNESEETEDETWLHQTPIQYEDVSHDPSNDLSDHNSSRSKSPRQASTPSWLQTMLAGIIFVSWWCPQGLHPS